MSQSDLQRANKDGRRVFYERGTDTLRQAPENYCLAVRAWVRGRFRWSPAVDAGSTINNHSMGLVLDQWQNGSTAAALASAVEEAFWGK